MSEKAVKAEAQGDETVTVKWRDLDEFEVPTDRDAWPFEAHLALEESKFFVVLRELLPPRTLAQFRATRPTGKDAADLFNAIAEALGFSDSGESSASTT